MADKPRVLIVGRFSALRESVISSLNKHYRILVAPDVEAAKGWLIKDHFALVIVGFDAEANGNTVKFVEHVRNASQDPPRVLFLANGAVENTGIFDEGVNILSHVHDIVRVAEAALAG